MIDYQDTIARILGVNKNVIRDLERNLNKATGRFGVMKTIYDKNDNLVSKALGVLGVSANASKTTIEAALLLKAEIHNSEINKFLDNPDLKSEEGLSKVTELAARISDHKIGFFLKKEKARELMLKEPPKNILNSLGYETVEEMLMKEDLLEVYSGLRFLEDPEWLNNIFFKQYENLKPEDFEERQVTVKPLSTKWIAATEHFVQKKFHNVSHLKELGVIFIIPVSFGVRGEIIRLFGLLSHYFNEIYFYSELFRMLAWRPESFSSSLISLLRGDVLDSSDIAWGQGYLIIQRYLAKIDPSDPRLYEPHLNPEALHWMRAENSIVHIGTLVPELKTHLDFWENLTWVALADPFVSFNMIDVIMSLVKGGEGILYSYHLREALWNNIFIEYFGEEKVREIIKNNIIRGYFTI